MEDIEVITIVDMLLIIAQPTPLWGPLKSKDSGLFHCSWKLYYRIYFVSKQKRDYFSVISVWFSLP